MVASRSRSVASRSVASRSVAPVYSTVQDVCIEVGNKASIHTITSCSLLFHYCHSLHLNNTTGIRKPVSKRLTIFPSRFADVSESLLVTFLMPSCS